MSSQLYDLENLKIMIVEDNQPILDILRSVLKSFGVRHTYGVRNGNSAYKLLKEIDLDLVICDWMMEPCNGLEFTQKVRNDPASPDPFLPIIFLTGYSEEHRVKNARDAGVNEFLAKPFKPIDLYERIAHIMDRPRKYIKSRSYFGPDRRRKDHPQFDGAKKRSSDGLSVFDIDPDQLLFVENGVKGEFISD